MTLIERYTSLLKALDVTVDPTTGQLFYQPNNLSKPVPLKITIQHDDCEPETFPIQMLSENTANEQEDFKFIKFHPLSESPFTSESEMLNLLLLLAGGKLCALSSQIILQLTELAVQFKEGNNFTNQASKVIRQIPSLKGVKKPERVVEYCKRVLSSCTALKGEHPMLRLNLSRRKRKDTKEAYTRWCELSVKAFDDMDGTSIFGVKKTINAEYNVVQGAFAVAFGLDPSQPIEPPISLFFHGTKTNTCPSFSVFLETLRSVFEHFSGIQQQLGRHADKSITFEKEWYGLLDNIEDYAEEFPVTYDGNIGRTKDGGVEITPTANKKVEVRKTSVKSTPAPVQTKPAPVVAKEPTPMTQETNQVAQDQPAAPQESAKSAVTLGGGIKSALSSYNRQSARISRRPMENTMTAPKLSARPENSYAEPTVQSGRVRLATRQEQEVQLMDSTGEPVFDNRGVPVFVKPSEVPQEYFIIGRDPATGQIQYENDGQPVLYPVNEQELNHIMQSRNMGGYPQQGGYPPQNGGYPQQGGYPPQGGYPQQGGYPPQGVGYPQQPQVMNSSYYGSPEYQQYNQGPTYHGQQNNWPSQQQSQYNSSYYGSQGQNSYYGAPQQNIQYGNNGYAGKVR